DAPRDLMWKAWTEEDRLAQWFSPKGVKTFHSKNDLRVGGIYHYGLRNPDGAEYYGKWVYREIVKPEKLVFLVSFSDANAGVTRHPMAPEWPREMLSTITFEERQEKTTVTVRWSAYNATEGERKTFEAGRDSMKQGGTGTMDQLEAYLSRS
ncbi:MAG: polyketide cyclase, partial [Acidobacteria bacterium]